MTLGNSSTLNESLTNTTGAALTVTSVGISNGSFALASNSICVGELPAAATCNIPITFTPASATHSKGTLSISTSAGTLSAALSGAGVGPKVTSLSAHSAAPFSNVSFNGSGFAVKKPVLVNFSEKPKGQSGAVTFSVPAILNQGSSIQVIVPPIFSPLTHQLVAGTATVSLQELLSTGAVSSKSPPLQITTLNGNSPVTPGEVTTDFVQAEANFATQLATEVPGTALAGVQTSLNSVSSSLSGLLCAANQSERSDAGQRRHHLDRSCRCRPGVCGQSDFGDAGRDCQFVGLCGESAQRGDRQWMPCDRGSAGAGGYRKPADLRQ